MARVVFRLFICIFVANFLVLDFATHDKRDTNEYISLFFWTSDSFASFPIKLQNLSANELYFMPYENKAALATLIKNLADAKSNINIAIYSFTNREIAKALRDAAARGVRINIIYDKSQNISNKQSTIGYLAKMQNINVCVMQGRDAGRYNGIMHHKLAIVDSEILMLGSANWSKNAFENNYESFMVTRDSELIKKSQNAFLQMAKECKRY